MAVSSNESYVSISTNHWLVTIIWLIIKCLGQYNLITSGISCKGPHNLITSATSYKGPHYLIISATLYKSPYNLITFNNLCHFIQGSTLFKAMPMCAALNCWHSPGVELCHLLGRQCASWVLAAHLWHLLSRYQAGGHYMECCSSLTPDLCPEQLKEWQRLQEEAAKRDHKKLGKVLHFTCSLHPHSLPFSSRFQSSFLLPFLPLSLWSTPILLPTFP